MERMQVQFTSEQARELRERARQRRVSTAAIVREAVDAMLRDLSSVASRRDRWQRAQAAAGRFGSGSSEPVARDHDRYLEDIYRS